MIRPSDIETKDFKKVALGYSPDEVDEFLDEILIDYDRFYKESVEMKDKIGLLNQDVDYYRSIEQSLQKTFSLAEKTADEIKEAAEAKKRQIEEQSQRHAEEMLKNAQMQSEQILKNANAKLLEVKQEIIKLENQYELMKKRVKLLLYAEIDLIDKNDIFAEKEANQNTK